MLDSARLRVSDERRWGWLRRAAELTESALDDRAGAIRIWRRLHEQAPADEAAREALARLYEQRTPLCRRRRPAGRRAAAQRRSGAAPRAAARDRPAGSAARAAQQRARRAAGQPGRAAGARPDAAQARPRSCSPRAARRSWPRSSSTRRAPGGRRRAGGLGGAVGRSWRACSRARSPTRAGRRPPGRTRPARADTEALDALGRLALAAGDAVGGRRVARSPADDDRKRRPQRRRRAQRRRCPQRGRWRLAAAYVAAGQRHRAIACLERALGEFPRADRLRNTLAGLYREAPVLGAAGARPRRGLRPQRRRRADGRARAREVAEICARLGLLERAVPVLEKAVGLVPRARGAAPRARRRPRPLRPSRRGARASCSRLVEQAGWRRHRKRAHLHQRLAEVARAQGDTTLALAEFEQASSMDGSNPAILTQLAEVAEAAGDLERAERAYRTLLVQRARSRQEAPQEARKDAAAPPADLALTEILLRLYGLARKRGHAAEADELLDSALAAAIKDPEQASRLQRGLLRAGAHDELGAAVREAAGARGRHARREAEISAELAESLRAQGKPEAAFEAQLRAVEAAPSSPRPARAARRARARGRAAAAACRSAARARRAAPPQGRHGRRGSTLLLLAADIAERDFGDQTRARSICITAPRRCSRGRSTCCRASPGWRSSRATSPSAIASRARVQARRRRGAHAGGGRGGAVPRRRARAGARRDARGRASPICAAALEKSARSRSRVGAGEGAGCPRRELVKILPLYERIARQSGDDAVLLDYLERRVATPDVIGRRGSRGRRPGRGARPRRRAWSRCCSGWPTSRPSAADGRDDAAWALFELIRIKKAAGDLDARRALLQRAAELLPLERVVPLARDLAERAGRAGNRRLGAELLERLRATAPADESVWRPLLDHYVSLQRPRRPRPPGRGDAAAAAGRRAAKSAAHGARPLAAGRATAATAPPPTILRDVLLEEAGARGGAGAAGRVLRAQRRRGRSRRPADAGVRGGDRRRAIPRASSRRRSGWAACWNGRTRERAAAHLRTRAGRRAPAAASCSSGVLALRPTGTATPRARGADGGAARRRDRRRGGAPGPRARGDLDRARRRARRRGACSRRATRRRPATRRSSPSSNASTAASRTGRRSRTFRRPRPQRREDAAEAAALYVEAASLRRGRLADVKGSLRAAAARAHARAAGHPDRRAARARAGRARRAGRGRRRGARGGRRPAPRDPDAAPAVAVAAREAGGGPRRSPRGGRRAGGGVHAVAGRGDAGAGGRARGVAPDAAASNAIAELRDATLALAELARRRGRSRSRRGCCSASWSRAARRTPHTVRLTWELAEADGDADERRSPRPSTSCASRRATRRSRPRGQLVALAGQHGQGGRGRGADRGGARRAPRPASAFSTCSPRSTNRRASSASWRGCFSIRRNRAADDGQRFDQLRRAGAFALAGPGRIARRHGAERGAGRPPRRRGDGAAAVRRLRADRRRSTRPPRSDAARSPRAKASRQPALAALYVRLAHIAGLAGTATASWPRSASALDADKKNGELACRGRGSRRGGRRRRAGAEGPAADRRPRRRPARSACPRRSCVRRASPTAAARPSAPSCSPAAPRRTRPRATRSRSKRAPSWKRSDAAPCRRARRPSPARASSASLTPCRAPGRSCAAATPPSFFADRSTMSATLIPCCASSPASCCSWLDPLFRK